MSTKDLTDSHIDTLLAYIKSGGLATSRQLLPEIEALVSEVKRRRAVEFRLSAADRADLFRLKECEQATLNAIGHLDLVIVVQCGRTMGLIDRILAADEAKQKGADGSECFVCHVEDGQ